MNNELVGEFIGKPKGSFVVVEIEDGFKRPSSIDDKDPIRYLIERL